MTLAEAGEIFRYWEDNPPAHLMTQIIARLLGWKPQRPAPASSLADLAAAPPPGLAIADGADLAMPAAVLAPDELRARNRALAMAQRRSQPLSRPVWRQHSSRPSERRICDAPGGEGA
jgi:hypothetical protein